MEYYPTAYPTDFQPFPRRTSSPRQNMSIAATFRLAQQARGKLSFEASRQDHDLRLLVGHANLLDSLMVELSEAERRQERWFDDIREEEEEEEEYEDEESDDEYEDEMEYELEQPEIYGSLPADYDSDSSDSDSDCDEEEEYFAFRRMPTKPYHHHYDHHLDQRTREITVAESELSDDSDDEMMIEDINQDDEDGLYSLTRTSSHQSFIGSPPSLCSDLSDDEDFDDHSMPPSPPQPVLHHPPPTTLAKSKDAATMISGFFDIHGDGPPRELGNHGFFDDVPLFPRAPTIATF